jgi:hypothetical protein
MPDPARLRAMTGSLEAWLLEGASTSEPSVFAEEEVLRRVQVTTAAVVAAGATGLVARALAASSNLIKGGVSLTVVKSVMVVALPAVLLTHWASHRASNARAVAARTDAPRIESLDGASRGPAPSDSVREAVAPAAASPLKAVAPRTRPETSSSEMSALRRESQGLGAARAQLSAGNAVGALDAVARLGLEFPRGKLVQEREVLAMDCLVALGHGAAAAMRAQAFLDRFPASPYEARVRQLAAR